MQPCFPLPHQWRTSTRSLPSPLAPSRWRRLGPSAAGGAFRIHQSAWTTCAGTWSRGDSLSIPGVNTKRLFPIMVKVRHTFCQKSCFYFYCSCTFFLSPGGHFQRLRKPRPWRDIIIWFAFWIYPKVLSFEGNFLTNHSWIDRSLPWWRMGIPSFLRRRSSK